MSGAMTGALDVPAGAAEPHGGATRARRAWSSSERSVVLVALARLAAAARRALRLGHLGLGRVAVCGSSLR